MIDRTPPTSSDAEQRRRQAEARELQAQARASHADRKADDRRNVLLGEFLAHAVERNPKLRSYVESTIYRFHVRERDQAFLRSWFATLPTKAPHKPE